MSVICPSVRKRVNREDVIDKHLYLCHSGRSSRRSSRGRDDCNAAGLSAAVDGCPALTNLRRRRSHSLRVGDARRDGRTEGDGGSGRLGRDFAWFLRCDLGRAESLRKRRNCGLHQQRHKKREEVEGLHVCGRRGKEESAWWMARGMVAGWKRLRSWRATLDIHCSGYSVGDRGGTLRPCLTLAASLT